MRIDLNGSSVEFVPGAKALGHIEDAWANPDFKPVEPRYAATVMLVRDSAPGQTEYRIESSHFPPDFPTGQELEVFMLRRVKTMAFAADAVVFPGGRVDDADADPLMPWAGPSPSDWAHLMGVPEDVARKVVVAAARELFEECGVLLAGSHEGDVLQDLGDPSWQQARDALERHEISFAEFLSQNGLLLRTDLLGLISNFCTPEAEPRRYDTFFFSALLPEGQQADGATGEAQIADWVTPAYTMRAGDAGNWLVLAPTVYNLTCVAAAKSAAELVSTRRPLTRFMSVPKRREDGTIVLHCDFPTRK